MPPQFERVWPWKHRTGLDGLQKAQFWSQCFGIEHAIGEELPDLEDETAADTNCIVRLCEEENYQSCVRQFRVPADQTAGELIVADGNFVALTKKIENSMKDQLQKKMKQKPTDNVTLLPN